MNGIVILGCGASFRSRSPHIFSATLLHLTLIISLTCGSCPLTLQREDRHQETRGPLFLTTGFNARGRRKSRHSLKLVVPIRHVKYAYPNGSCRSTRCFKPKVCHMFLIVPTGLFVRAAPIGARTQTRGPEMYRRLTLTLRQNNISRTSECSVAITTPA